jgi:hypothetical protein
MPWQEEELLRATLEMKAAEELGALQAGGLDGAALRRLLELDAAASRDRSGARPDEEDEQVRRAYQPGHVYFL